MDAFEFPKSNLTYFCVVPDIKDNIFVERKEGKQSWYYAAVIVDGHVPVDGENRPQTQYYPSKNRTPVLIRFSKATYDKLQAHLEDVADPFNPLSSVCIGVLRAGGGEPVPFLATVEGDSGLARINLHERYGEEVLLAAIAEATKILPTDEPKPRGNKSEGALNQLKTKRLSALLDMANELPEEQLVELLQIVDATLQKRYVIKMRPTDMNLPHIRTGGVT